MRLRCDACGRPIKASDDNGLCKPCAFDEENLRLEALAEGDYWDDDED